MQFLQRISDLFIADVENYLLCFVDCDLDIGRRGITNVCYFTCTLDEPAQNRSVANNGDVTASTTNRGCGVL